MIYAVFTPAKPDRTALELGCPASGWVHENNFPWRVLTSDDPEVLNLFTSFGDVVEYTGDEDTVDFEDWLAELDEERDDRHAQDATDRVD